MIKPGFPCLDLLVRAVVCGPRSVVPPESFTLTNYPNYRVSVEAILRLDGKVLIARRADDCDVAPGVWNVPAGKVRYDEIPVDAVVRECREEIGIEVSVVREIDCRACTILVRGEEAYRLIYTYLVEPAREISPDSIRLNDEHTRYAWVDRQSIDSPEYDTLSPKLREIIAAVLRT